MVYNPIRYSQLGGKRWQFRLAREKTVGSAFDHKAVHILCYNHATSTALTLENRDIELSARAHQLPPGGEPGDACAYYHYLQSQPRCVAAVRTTSATALTRPGSSFNDFVRSR